MEPLGGYGEVFAEFNVSGLRCGFADSGCKAKLRLQSGQVAMQVLKLKSNISTYRRYSTRYVARFSCQHLPLE